MWRCPAIDKHVTVHFCRPAHLEEQEEAKCIGESFSPQEVCQHLQPQVDKLS